MLVEKVAYTGLGKKIGPICQGRIGRHTLFWAEVFPILGQSGEEMLSGHCGGGLTTMYTQLGEHRRDMMIHGLGRQIQACGDLGIGQVFRQEAQDVQLASREAEGIAACRGAWSTRDLVPASRAHVLSQVGGSRLRAKPIKNGECRGLGSVVTIGEGPGLLVRAATLLPGNRRRVPITRHM